MTLPKDIAAWRKQQRADLLARRSAISPEHRQAWSETLTRLLVTSFPSLERATIGFCWPFQGEFDVRFAIRHWRERGAVVALPVVVAKAAPLEFRQWWPGCVTTPGVLDLPIPQGTPLVRPDTVLVPPVGFDARGYRLGYGGGYFDRTLAAMTPQPLKIGVAFEPSRMPTIRPQDHDIPMDFIVTPNGVHARDGEGLRVAASPAEVQELTARLEQERGTRSRTATNPEAPPLAREQMVSLLNTLLEAERAGAKVLAAFLGDYPSGSHVWRELERVQRDEAANCAILMNLLRGLDAIPSSATGDFVGKALAVEGKRERLAFLNRGQGWVARTLREHLPRLAAGELREALAAMHDSHVANIAACNALGVPED